MATIINFECDEMIVVGNEVFEILDDWTWSV